MADSSSLIEFQSEHLLSKWGFDDGDLLIPTLKNNGFPNIDTDNDFWIFFNRLVLCEVVERFVCTQIENQIKPYRCLSSHNPIRIYEIDGHHVSNLPINDLILRPWAIAVKKTQIIATAKQLYQERRQFKDSNGDWSYLISSEVAKITRVQQGWE
ncbi:hypothetical protein Lepto7376_2758 [[Leptolyngbya] sp. PCC 7376]|nr:hypothetical protein Lepto7376_2758 [[Leptolyngbya] sp. PCC 7376]